MLAKVDLYPRTTVETLERTLFPDWFSQPQAHGLPFRFNAQRTMHWLTFTGNPGYWKSVPAHRNPPLLKQQSLDLQ